MLRWIIAVLRAWPRLVKLYFFSIKRHAKNIKKYPYSVRWKKVKEATSYISKRLKLDFHVEGLENLSKDKKQFFASNHVSSFDPLATLSVVDKHITFVSKIEVEKYPVIPNVIRSIEGIFIDRKNLKQSLKVMLAVQRDLENPETDKSWLIYPEGTRNPDEFACVQDFHSGTFRSAYKTGVDIVPVCIYGTQRVLKMNKFKKIPIHISFLKPITYEEYKDMSTEDIAKMVHDLIQQELTFNIRKKDHEYMLKYNKKHYKFNELQ